MKLALPMLLLMIWQWLASPASAGMVTLLTDSRPAVIVGTHLDFLHDPDGRLGIHDVASAAMAGSFSNTGKAGFDKGLTYDVYWLRLKVLNHSSRWQRWYLQVNGVDESPLQVYLKAGDAAPVKLTVEPYFHYHNYPLMLAEQGQYTVYIRLLNHNDRLSCHVRFVQAAEQANIHEVFFYTLITGGLLALGFYNLFLFASLRMASYGWLGLAILSLTLELNRFTGLFHQYIVVWPAYHQAYAAFGFLAIAAYVAFFRELLASCQRLPLIDKAFRVLFWIAVVALFNSAWLPFATVCYTALILVGAILVSLTVARLYWLRLPFNQKLGWALWGLVIGAMPTMANGLGLITGFAYGQQLAFLVLFLFSLMLSLAQADHVRLSREQAARAEAANRAKGEFLTTMSHELRTPMNAVVGASALLRQAGLNSRQQGYVEKLEIAARHMLELISDVLDLTRIEQQELLLEDIPFDLQALLAELEALFAEQAASKGLALRLYYPVAAPDWLQGDPTR